MTPRPNRLLLLVALVFSGAGGLGLQLTWTRQLALTLGHELPALLSVLTAFFGGLALGSWGWERLASRRPFHPLLPAAVELVIGLWALTTAVVLVPFSQAVQSVLPAENAGLPQGLLALSASWILLLPATAAMGATVPAILTWLSRSSAERTPSTGVGALYAANTTGAVLGTWGSVIWLQPRLGLRLSVIACAGLHLLSAGLLVWAKRQMEGRGPLDSRPLTPQKKTSNPLPLAGPLALTGFLGLALEIVANRALAPVLEGTVYTHAAILGVFLLATALGSALERPRPTNPAPPLSWLAVATLGAGHALIHVRDWNDWLRDRLPATLGGLFVTESLMALTVVGAPCLLMGSSLVRLVNRARSSGFTTGSALAWNTAGAALAGPLFGVVLLPWIGIRWAVVAIALGYAVLGWTGFGRSPSPGFRFAGLGVAAALGLLGLGLPSDLGAPPPPPGARWLALHTGRSETVGVSESPDGHRALSVQGRFTLGGTGSTNAAARQVLLPLAWHPHPKRLLVLGLGTGISLGAATSAPEVQSTGIELLPEVVAMHPWFLPHNSVPAGSRVVTADARRFLRSAGDPYDVIVGDLYHPARDGAGTLYTREQFAAMKARLSPEGLAVQWLPLYQLDAPTLRAIIQSFLEVFPEAHAWLLRPTLDTPVLGLVGRLGTWSIGESDWAQRVPIGSFRTRLQAAGLGSAEAVYGTWMAGPRALEAFAAGAEACSDDAPSVVFLAPKLAAQKAGPPGELLIDLLDRFSGEGTEFPIREIAQGWGRRLAAYRAARDEYLRGLVADDRGSRSDAEGAFLRSARLSADFTLGYSQLITRAMLHSRSDPAGTRRLLESLQEARPEQPVARQLLDRLGFSRQ